MVTDITRRQNITVYNYHRHYDFLCMSVDIATNVALLFKYRSISEGHQIEELTAFWLTGWGGGGEVSRSCNAMVTKQFF